MSLLRGAEYSRLTSENGREALTFYDMNLSAQDHQTFFTCEYDEGKPDYEIMQRAWRERNPASRIALANEALDKNPEYKFQFKTFFSSYISNNLHILLFDWCFFRCTPALILLAEEEAQTIIDVGRNFCRIFWAFYKTLF